MRRTITIFATQEQAAVAIKKPALEARAGVYLGSSAALHKYGVQMNEETIIVVTINTAAAFFSFVCPHTDAHQPRIRELTPQVPIVKTTTATYQPARFKVAKAATKPTVATDLEMVVCQVRSLKCPDDHDTAMVTNPAIR